MQTALKQSRGLVNPAARALKCSPRTVRRYINKYPTIKEVVSDERENMIDAAEAALFQEIEGGNMTAIIFTLKTVGKDRGYVERVEQSGPGGAPIEGKQEIQHVIKRDSKTREAIRVVRDGVMGGGTESSSSGSPGDES